MADQNNTLQSITLRIAGKEYPLRVKSPEAEQYMRIAAENINNMLAMYDEKFPDKSTLDKLAFVALNETVSKLAAQKKFKVAEDDAKKLSLELDNYLQNIERNR